MSIKTALEGPALDKAKAEVVQRILQLGAAGIGIGAAGRGLVGLKNMFQQPYTVPFVSPGPSTLEVPNYEEEEAEQLAGGPQYKAAEDLLAILAKEAAGDPSIMSQIGDAASSAAGTVGDAVKELPNQIGKMLPSGPLTRSVSDVSKAPWVMPLTVGAATAGVAGGWKLTDWLLQRRRKAMLSHQLQDAQAEYEAALAEQHAGGKAASAQPYSSLDQLFDTYLEKRANPLIDFSSQSIGALLTAMGVAGIGGGLAGYHWQKGRSQAALLDKAMKERARQLWARSPQQLAVVPKGLPV